jgi:outer membrane translocation and assembly module TamA
MLGEMRCCCLALGLVQTLFWSTSVCGHPIQDDGCAAQSPSDPQPLAIAIDSVEFQADEVLTPEIRARLIDELKGGSFHASSAADTDWQAEVRQKILTPLQDQGYFKTVVDITSGLIRADPGRLHYWVTVQVESGTQYRLGEVRFENVAELSDRALRPEIPLRNGELFNVSSIREGLKRITSLYGSRGYIDATIEPQFAIDSQSHQIDITFKVAPGIQYRIGPVQIRGWSAEAEKLFRSKFEWGQVFDWTALSEFFAENKTVLRSGATLENNVTLVRDAHNGRVGINFERRPCHAP